MKKPIYRKENRAKLIRDSHSFFNVGEKVVVREYDDSDDTYLVTKPHEKFGIWVKRSIFKYIDEIEDDKYYKIL